MFQGINDIMRYQWGVTDTLWHIQHKNKDPWNGNVDILMKFSSPAAPEIVKLTTSGTAIDENSSKWKHFHLDDIVPISVLFMLSVLD